MSEHGNEHSHNDAEVFFRDQDAVMKRIYEAGVEKFIESVANLEHAFEMNNGVVSCIDEGTPHGDIRFAGSGILKEDILDTLERLKKDGKLDCITSHDECGAAKLFAAKNGKDSSRADQYARVMLEEMAEELGVRHEHINISQMKRPSGMHVARVIYYDGTGKFNPSRNAMLPKGFVISRFFHRDAEDALNETKIAMDIALGAHGFGDLVTNKEPLVVIAVGSSRDVKFSQFRLKMELRPLVRNYKDRVVLDGFTAPA